VTDDAADKSTLGADERLAGLAEAQQGAVNLAQIREAGLSDEQLGRRVRSRRILPTGTRTVYRLPGAPRTWRQALWVAVLANPEGALVSHTSAAALFDLFEPPDVPHLTVPRNASGRKRGSVIHHAAVAWADRGQIDGLPVTRVPRTIVDCAALLDQPRLNSLVDGAIGRGLTNMPHIRAAHDRAGPVRGGATLAEALAPYSGTVSPRSVKEAHVLRLLRAWGLPAPECQYRIRNGDGQVIATVDFGWAPWRVALEYDGDEFHSPRAWGADDNRQARIEALGWRLERADRFDLRPSSTRLRDLLTGLLRLAA
jgi:hypothetical protein